MSGDGEAIRILGGGSAMTQRMILTLGLAIVGQILYQVGQRAVPANASPFAVLTVAYFAAGILSVLLAAVFGGLGSGTDLRAAVSWPTWLIAAAIVAIEVGYLVAYRSGWTIGTAFVTASTITVIVLALIGWVFLGNALSMRQIAGIICACLAVWLLSGGGIKVK
jgi:drug/metabolite transporter (DMT)-like permease